MLCLNCRKGTLKSKVIEDMVSIDGGPSFRVSGLKVLKCTKCGDILIDCVTAAERTKKVISGLIKFYASKSDEMPGKVAQWLRKAIGLSIAEFSELTGMDPSTFTRASQRNSPIDHYAAIVLLALAADFVTGGHAGKNRLREIQELDQLLDPDIVDSVEIA